MVRLAEFLGIPCETLALANVAEHAEFLEKTLPDQCFVFRCEPAGDERMGRARAVFRPIWLLFSCHVSRTCWCMACAWTLSTPKWLPLCRGADCSPWMQSTRMPLIMRSPRIRSDVCEAFSGLSFGPANPVNDHVFSIRGGDPAVQQLISIGGRPFMAAVKLEGAEILFVASEDVADLNAEVGDAPLAEYFSRFVPHAMALRYVAGDECWRPCKAHASIIIDDPLLRKSYGFLNFESLLRLAKQHNFHTAIAFIPHNFRRSSPRITRMFRENASRLSICFHGNDHTEAEFASTDIGSPQHLAPGRGRSDEFAPTDDWPPL